jgi:hypothetical protein
MCRAVLHAADANASVQVISASRGKALRAEPVSALYEQGLVHHVGRFAVLEDQLCAFTTAGYRGEGSPDHADALVFAITELMLQESAPIIEFYRQQAEGRHQVQVEDAAGVSDAMVALRAPAGVSAVHGYSGALYVVGADGIVTVKPEDAGALVAHGYERVTAEND